MKFSKFTTSIIALSVAAAFSGLAALVWSNHNNCTGTETRNALNATAEDNGTPGRDDYFGNGIVKVEAADVYLTTNGCVGGATPPPAGGDITGTISETTSKGSHIITLTWEGASSSTVDTYQICDLGTTNCSPDLTVTF
jgi:hypothetical protein